MLNLYEIGLAVSGVSTDRGEKAFRICRNLWRGMTRQV